MWPRSCKAAYQVEIMNLDLSIPGHNAPIVYFKLRLVPVHDRYVIIYIRNVRELVEQEKANEALSSKLSESRMTDGACFAE